MSDTSPPRELRVLRAIRLLAAGRSAADVAAAARIMPRTLAAWQADADFRALLDCVSEHGSLRAAFAALQDLTPAAIDSLRRAIESSDDRVAVQAARDVLDRVGIVKERAHEQPAETIIRVEYGTPDGHPYSSAPWADRNPPTSGAVQGGGVRSPLREDGDGQTDDD